MHRSRPTTPRPRTARTRRSALAALTGLCLVAAACGGDGGDRAGGEVVDRPTTTAAVADDGAAGGADDPTATAPDGPDGAVRPSPGCDGPAVAPVADERRALDVDGAERWYILTTPEPGTPDPDSPDPDSPDDGGPVPVPVPLVLDLHGLAEGAEVHTRMARYGELGRAEGFAVVLPQGGGRLPSWDVRPGEANPDLRFLDALLDRLGDDLCLDLSRVYATGLSNGAFMASALACTRGDRIAAVAPVAGVQFPDGCTPSRPVPVWAVHGTADPILLFNGGIGELGRALDGGMPTVPPGSVADLDGAGYPEAARRWAAHNGCEPAPTDTRLAPQVLQRAYDCPDGAEVVFVVVEGGGHSWPGSEFNRTVERATGPVNMDLDATRVTWEFLRQHRLPG